MLIFAEMCVNLQPNWNKSDIIRNEKIYFYTLHNAGLCLDCHLLSERQRHSSNASILQCSAFFIVQLSHPYLTTGKTIALTRWTFVGKVMSLLFNMLSRLVIAFLSRSKCLLISWLQSCLPLSYTKFPCAPGCLLDILF